MNWEGIEEWGKSDQKYRRGIRKAEKIKLTIGAHMSLRYKTKQHSRMITPPDVNGVVDISWVTNKSVSARSTVVAFYSRVTWGVIYIFAGKTAA